MSMTDADVRDYLSENGYPEHMVRGGREGLKHQWREFVEQVERGYTRGIEAYRNDLDVRGIIALAKIDDGEIHDLDQRIKKVLTATSVRIWESGPGESFWDFGYPINAGPELVADLRNEKLLL